MNVSAVTQTIPVVTDADGVIRVANTRVPLETLIDAFQNGATAEEIAQQYPSISLADVYSVIGYYLHQRSEIEAYLARRRQVAEQVRLENERRFSPEGIRARLLARRTDKTV